MAFIEYFKLVTLICMLAFSNLSEANLNCLKGPILPRDIMKLSKQDKALIRDLMLINYPPKEWKHEPILPDAEPFFYDVVIVGGGMAGLSVGAALFKEGIFNIKIFFFYSSGYEGPWINYARMRTLRSQKDLMGPALDIPHLTFHAWFEAQWGQEAWKQLGKISNGKWMEYLTWYGQAMQLPIENEWNLISLMPREEGFKLEFEQAGNLHIIYTRKVVLATGRGGFGGSYIPDVIKVLPSTVYAHTASKIDFEKLKNCRIAIIGVGASGFDAAAVALETGAKSVDLIMRRARLPNVNKVASLYYKSFAHGFFKLSDQKRWDFMCTAFDDGISPPIEALQRLQEYQNFHLSPSTIISQLHFDGLQIHMTTNKGKRVYDFIILGTGFQIDGYQQRELQHVINDIKLWKDQMPAEILQQHPNLGGFPYLGPTFEFLPKEPGTGSYLKNLYCFNYGATMSHSFISSDIPAISIGARRLAEGIAADFFIQDSDFYLKQLKEFNEPDFNQDHFFPISND